MLLKSGHPVDQIIDSNNNNNNNNVNVNYEWPTCCSQNFPLFHLEVSALFPSKKPFQVVKLLSVVGRGGRDLRFFNKIQPSTSSQVAQLAF